jgi:hypothetical protein
VPIMPGGPRNLAASSFAAAAMRPTIRCTRLDALIPHAWQGALAGTTVHAQCKRGAKRYSHPPPFVAARLIRLGSGPFGPIVRALTPGRSHTAMRVLSGLYPAPPWRAGSSQECPARWLSIRTAWDCRRALYCQPELRSSHIRPRSAFDDQRQTGFHGQGIALGSLAYVLGAAHRHRLVPQLVNQWFTEVSSANIQNRAQNPKDQHRRRRNTQHRGSPASTPTP